jgi:hypothetical protein
MAQLCAISFLLKALSVMAQTFCAIGAPLEKVNGAKKWGGWRNI